MNKKSKRKIYFTIGGNYKGEGCTKVESSWNPGRTRPSKRFKRR